MTTKPAHYELMLILKPDLGEKTTKTTLNEIREAITDHKGVIQFEDLWEKRDLAYSIKGYEEGYYVILYFDMAHNDVLALTKELDLIQSILRKMMVTLPSSLEIKSYVEEMKKREAEAEAEYREVGEKRAAKNAKKEEASAAKASKRVAKEVPVEEVIIEDEKEVVEDVEEIIEEVESK